MKILDNGTILNESNIKKIQPTFKKLTEEAMKRITLELKPISIYLRGSLSEGKGLKYMSDIDIVVFKESTSDKKEIKKVLQIIDSLEHEFSIVSEVDITILTHKLLMSSKYKRLRVYLKTQSCLLYGKDVISDITPFKANKKLALFMYSNINKELLDFYNYFKNDESRSYLSRVRAPEFWCRWTMRTILRSGLGLVMFKKAVYTPNLHKCAEIISTEFPQLSVDIKKVLMYEMNPMNDKEKITSFLDKFLPKYLYLWNEKQKNNLSSR